MGALGNHIREETLSWAVASERIPDASTWWGFQPAAIQGLAFALLVFDFLFALFLKAQDTDHLWQS